jgi:hypothetical protein
MGNISKEKLKSREKICKQRSKKLNLLTLIFYYQTTPSCYAVNKEVVAFKNVIACERRNSISWRKGVFEKSLEKYQF